MPAQGGVELVPYVSRAARSGPNSLISTGRALPARSLTTSERIWTKLDPHAREPGRGPPRTSSDDLGDRPVALALGLSRTT